MERLAAVHKKEMDDCCQSAIDAASVRDELKERLEEDLAEARRALVDQDAPITECLGKLHTHMLSEFLPPCLVVFWLVEPGLVF